MRLIEAIEIIRILNMKSSVKCIHFVFIWMWWHEIGEVRQSLREWKWWMSLNFTRKIVCKGVIKSLIMPFHPKIYIDQTLQKLLLCYHQVLNKHINFRCCIVADLQLKTTVNNRLTCFITVIIKLKYISTHTYTLSRPLKRNFIGAFLVFWSSFINQQLILIEGIINVSWFGKFTHSYTFSIKL